MPPLLAGLLWLIDLWQLSRRRRSGAGWQWTVRWLITLCYLGTLTHPLLDLQTTYAVQLLSPFSPLWFHAETLFIIDASLWSDPAFAIWLSRAGVARGRAWRRPAIAERVAACAYIA